MYELEPQKELSKILGLNRGLDNYSSKSQPASWSEIIVEIGRLLERSERAKEFFPQNPQSTEPINVCGGLTPPNN